MRYDINNPDRYQIGFDQHSSAQVRAIQVCPS